MASILLKDLFMLVRQIQREIVLDSQQESSEEVDFVDENAGQCGHPVCY